MNVNDANNNFLPNNLITITFHEKILNGNTAGFDAHLLQGCFGVGRPQVSVADHDPRRSLVFLWSSHHWFVVFCLHIGIHITTTTIIIMTITIKGTWQNWPTEELIVSTFKYPCSLKDMLFMVLMPLKLYLRIVCVIVLYCIPNDSALETHCIVLMSMGKHF